MPAKDGQNRVSHALESASPEDRWRVWIAWQNSTFKAYLEAQQSFGLSREQALLRLARIWEREDQDRLEAYRRAAKILSHAR